MSGIVMAAIDIALKPTPDHLTLLFKCSRSTTLLSVLPEQDFTEIKAMLLAVLRARNLTTFPGSSVPLPVTADDLEFGKLVDRRDASKGWISLEERDSEATEGKTNKNKTSIKKSTVTNSPSGASLSDGSWIAYRMRKPKVDDGDDEVPDIDMEESNGWDVVLPSFDDEAGDADG